MRMNVPRVLLTDYQNSEISANLPELFRRAGCEVEIACVSDSWLLKNSYWQKWHEIKERNSVSYCKAVLTLTQAEQYDWVVLIDDYAIRVMNESISDPLLFKKILPLSTNKTREILGSKAGLSRLCQKYGILTPAFVVYDAAIEPLAQICTIGFPLLLKVDQSGGGRGVYLATDQKTFLIAFEKLSVEEKNNLIFQEYIVGDNVACEILFKNGEVLGYASSRVLKNTRGEFSASRVREYSNMPELETIVSRIATAFSCNGFSSSRFIRSKKTGQYFLIELDLRLQCWFYLDQFAGVDFSKLIARYLQPGLEVASAPVVKNEETITLRYFSRDLKWAIKRGNIFAIMRWCFNIGGCWRLTPWHDQKLFWAILIDLAKYFLYFIAPLRPLTRGLKYLYKKIVKRA